MKPCSRLVLLMVLIVCACDESDPDPAVEKGEVEAYMDEILNLMEKNSINRKTIDWTTFKKNVKDKSAGGIVISDAFPAIKFALRELGDNHSFYSYNNGTAALSGSTLVCTASPAAVNPIANIGYVKVNTFSGNQDQATPFANALHIAIKSQDNVDIKGWIVDLRSNGGGNMWPMVAGIGPVLGEGVCGYFINPDNEEGKWEYSAGKSMYNGTAVTTVAAPYTLFKQNPKVAVLTSQLTASSGEATAVAFIGRPNTKFFGVSTCGLPTANAGYELSDGAMLFLTVSDMADRNKNKMQRRPIVPDVTVDGDAAVTKAVEWLNEP